MPSRIACWVIVLAVSAAAPTAWAETILNFAPNPETPAAFEFLWDGIALQEGPGSVSNGDGHLGSGPGASAPGLLMSAPFIIPVPGSSLAGATTTFFDTTLNIVSGFGAPAGPAGNAISIAGLIIQPLGSGSFEIRSSNIGGGNLLLLAGTIEDAALSGIANARTGSVLSGTVTYTAGLIFNAMVSAGYQTTGELSWSVLNMSQGLAINGATSRIFGFSSDGTGQFSATAIPEPASLATFAAAAVLALRRRR